MKIVTAAEMREIDRITTEKYGIPSLTLMENAGSAVAEFILQEYPQAERIGIICGKGNNGGDGFVCARKLHEAGKQVSVLLLADPADLKGDAAAMYQRLPVPAVLARNEDEFSRPEAQAVYDQDLLVDAILGTGFKPPLRGLYEIAIQRMWQAVENDADVVSIDVPSGADADFFRFVPEIRPLSSYAPASVVVTFTTAKPGSVFDRLSSADVVIAPVGSPDRAIHSALGLHLVTAREAAHFVQPRSRDAHKGDFGHVLMIGGSVGKAGAAAMAGMAALRAGAGLVTVACPRSVLPTVAGFAPELMTEPLEETDQGTVSLRSLAYGRLDRLIEGKACVALGPGLSRHPESAEFARTVVQRFAAPMVIDADGLNAFEGRTELLHRQPGYSAEGALVWPIVVTPHPGEMARLRGEDTHQVEADRIATARSLAQERSLIVVFKGHRSLIADPGAQVWVNATGNPGMATGGVGDVLTGIIAAFIAQAGLSFTGFGYSPEQDEGSELKDLWEQNRELFERRQKGLRDGHFEDPTEEEQRQMAPFLEKMKEKMVEHARELQTHAVASAVYLHGLAGDIAREHLGEEAMIATDLLKYLPEAFRRVRQKAHDKFVRIHS